MDRKEAEALGERIAEHAAHLDAATHRLLTDIRSFEESGNWYSQGLRSCAQWLSWRVGWDANTAREHVRVAKRLGSLPKIDDALRRGEVSYSKVRAMTRSATPEIEDTLLDYARYATGSELERICRLYQGVQRHEQDTNPEDDLERRTITKRDLADGMVCIAAIVHPEEAAQVWSALDRRASDRC